MKAGYRFLICLLLLNLSMVGCSKSPDKGKKEVLSGEYYSFECDKGYKVLKVLEVEENLIHVCYYNNIFHLC